MNITSGLQIGGDEVECTFDSSRILYGEAKDGTGYYFYGIQNGYRFGNMVETPQNRETVTVGSMGLFSETLPLSRGNNYISFAAEGEAKTTTVIKQVPQQVKSQLQRMIALPGMGAKK